MTVLLERFIDEIASPAERDRNDEFSLNSSCPLLLGQGLLNIAYVSLGMTGKIGKSNLQKASSAKH